MQFKTFNTVDERASRMRFIYPNTTSYLMFGIIRYAKKYLRKYKR